MQQLVGASRQSKSITHLFLEILLFFYTMRLVFFVLLTVLWIASAGALLLFSLQHMGEPASQSQDSSSGFFLWYGLFIVVSCIWAFSIKRLRRSKKFGSARWATIGELQRQRCIMLDMHTSFLPLGGRGLFPIGIPQHQQESHVLLLAPTGKGKTSGIIIPGLLSEQGDRSLFINDVKGELIEKCLGALSLRFDCTVFAPTRPMQSHSYNPLRYASTMEDAEMLADCFVRNTGTSQQEPFWNNAAKLLITSVILHLRSAEPRAPLARLADIFSMMSIDDLQRLLLTSPSLEARRTATSFMNSLSLNTKLAGSVLADMATRFTWLNNPGVRQVTATNDFHFGTLIQRPCALFLSIPASAAQRLKPLSAAFIMQLMSHLQQVAELDGGRLRYPVVFYLDEFANTGYIPNYLNYISLVRSMGISLLMAVQNFGQLTSMYGEEGKDTILANATTHIVFPGCGPVETEHYALQLGMQTITTSSKSVPVINFNPVRAMTISSSEAPRSLMTLDEIRTMPLGQLLVISDNMHPYRVRNHPYYTQPDMQAQLRVPFPATVSVEPIEPEEPLELPPPGEQIIPPIYQAQEHTQRAGEEFHLP